MKDDLKIEEMPEIGTGSTTHSRGMLPYVLVFVMVALVAILGAVYYGKKTRLEAANNAGQADREATNVVVLTLNPATIRDRINLPAVVEPWVRLTLASEVRGKVVLKAVEEGTPVKKGDLIAVIDERDYVTAYHSAKAQYDTALASYSRLGELYKEQLATKSQLDTALAAMENSRAAMDTTALSVERCRITAPFSGTLNRIFFEIGQYINPGDSMAELLQMDRMKVNVGIPESDMESVRRLSEFDIAFDALGGRTVKGTKIFLSRTSDSAARLYSLKLAVDNPDRDILPDMFARVEIVKREADECVAVPLYSIITRNDENFAYIVEDDTAKLCSIQTGIQESWMVEVASGLSRGDRLIVTGHRDLEDGQKINIMQTLDHVEAVLQ